MSEEKEPDADEMKRRALESHRADADAVTAQARWLYEIHAKRAESAQQRATAIIALGGVLLTLAPKALPDFDNGYARGVLVATLVASATTIVFALTSLRPRPTGAPSAKELRKYWLRYRKSQAPEGAAMQIAEDLTRSTEMHELSAAELAKVDADYRIRWLKMAYWGLVVALVLTAAMTGAGAFEGGKS